MKSSLWIALAVALVVIGLYLYRHLAPGGASGNAQISAEEAKKIMDEVPDAVILDVRTPEEFAEAHIPGAICLPVDDIDEAAPRELPDKARCLLVYCRTGMRARTACAKLVKMGYTNVFDFGGINTWPYDLQKGA